MTDLVSLGEGPLLDLPELLTTRLFVQGSSGSGKTHLIKVLLEETASRVQQVVLDPDGDFGYLSTLFGHSVVDARAYARHLRPLAEQARRQQTSVVLDLSTLPEPADQVRAVGEFLSALFAVDATAWHPALVVIDEVHLFAGTESAGDKATRALAAAAVANLMCRGRKRGLCGVLASQRVAKVNKSAVADVLNFLVGRTFLDIDMRRAAGLVGLPRDATGRLVTLARGEFIARGPALGLAPTTLRVRAASPAPVASASGGLGPLVVPAVSAAGARRTERVLPAPLPALLASIAALAPALDYTKLAASTPGVLNAVHALRLVEALARAGYLVVEAGVYGKSVRLLRSP